MGGGDRVKALGVRCPKLNVEYVLLVRMKVRYIAFSLRVCLKKTRKLFWLINPMRGIYYVRK